MMVRQKSHFHFSITLTLCDIGINENNYVRTSHPRHQTEIKVTIYLDNTMSVSFDINFSGETRNTIGKARLAEPVRCVSGRA